MTTSPKPTKEDALKLALDILEQVDNRDDHYAFLSAEQAVQIGFAITAIREALAQPAADDKPTQAELNAQYSLGREEAPATFNDTQTWTLLVGYTF